MLRWTFQRGHLVVTCRVDRDTAASCYTLALIPHRHLDAMVVETFESGVRALARHASIAARLRQLGWTLVAYTRDAARLQTDRRPAAA